MALCYSRCFGNEIQPPAGRNPASRVEILTPFGRNLRALPADGKARRTFVLRALFTLAAIYSRGTCRPTTIDVLMFHFRVRNGTGWDHQAMTTGLLIYFVHRISYFVLQPARLSRCCGMFWWWRSGRLTSAWQCVGLITISFALRFHVESSLSPGVIHLGLCMRSIGC